MWKSDSGSEYCRQCELLHVSLSVNIGAVAVLIGGWKIMRYRFVPLDRLVHTYALLKSEDVSRIIATHTHTHTCNQ